MRATLANAQPRLALFSKSLDPATIDALQAAAADAVPVAAFDWQEQERSRFAPAAAAATTPGAALIVYTSGTTGVPKGALLSSRGVLEAARIYDRRYGRIRLLHNLPVNHVGGLVDTAAPTLLGGGALVFMDRFQPDRIPSVLAQERVTLWGQVPAMFEMTFASGAMDGRQLDDLKFVAWSGAPVSASLLARLAGLGAPLSNSYGLTESTGSVTFTDWGDAAEDLLDTVGRPVFPQDFRIAGPHGPLPPGETGEIQLRGPMATTGYHGDPEATREAFTDDGWLRTGDLAALDLGGRVRLVGRLKEMFKSGGYNVYPREVELVLESYPGVDLAAVMPEQDALWQEVGHAYVISREALDEQDLLRYCRDRLANYKIPKRVTVTRDLPLLPIGKIDKQALRRGLPT